ncbi:28S ribosomal protein S22, mitochondrial [Condylostylus longicornis]|uniref:28S ribosomal protein S22, mitochondrial n=1 Tax=Condylostylus longicornis TaxID=2530218 RepID=UPI00244E517C|nr:28S ribosomal protein S22, mitochondrial [Condylostylus longicornis]
MFVIARNGRRSLIFKLNSIRNFSNNTEKTSYYHYESDPGPKFIEPSTQRILKSLTCPSVEKVFRKKSSQNSIEYQFMTTEKLEKKFEEMSALADKYLQMPPVVMVKNNAPKIISNDPALKNFSENTHIFTDITFGLKQSERKVVIRHVDGTLENASMEVQKRMNQLYFPLKGRKLYCPKMLQEPHFQRCLDEFKYEFVLDRLCIQYEPYEKEYHDLTSTLYMHVNENKKFHDLRSTRHFGPMAFFFAWHKIIDDMLYDMIKKEYLRNGVELIALMNDLHNIEYDKKILDRIEKSPKQFGIVEELKKSLNSTPDDIHEEIRNAIGKSREDFEIDDFCLNFIENFVKSKALKRIPLELAIQTFKETNDEKRRLYEGLRKAHGIN